MITDLDKKRTAVFGAGQAGRMCATWMPSGSKLICFIDNNSNIQGSFVDGVPVVSIEYAIEQDLDLIFIAVLNRDAEPNIRRQIREAGYDGEIRSVTELRSLADIRMSAMRLIANEIKRKKIGGQIAELGVYRGAFAAEMNRELPDRKIYLFDTFMGFDERDLKYEESLPARQMFRDTDAGVVRKALPHPSQAVLVKGSFPDSLAGLEEADSLSFALVSIDPDLYMPALEGLRYFYPRLVRGGMILVHDYNSTQYPGIRRAVEEYQAEQDGVAVVPLMDLHGTAVIVKP